MPVVFSAGRSLLSGYLNNFRSCPAIYWWLFQSICSEVTGTPEIVLRDLDCLFLAKGQECWKKQNSWRDICVGIFTRAQAIPECLMGGQEEALRAVTLLRSLQPLSTVERTLIMVLKDAFMPSMKRDFCLYYGIASRAIWCHLKISTQLNIIMWLSKLFLTVQAKFFSIYKISLYYIMYILSCDVTVQWTHIISAFKTYCLNRSTG